MCADTIVLKSNAQYDDIIILNWPDLSFRHVTRQYMTFKAIMHLRTL